jgi:hypothetical protein
MTMAGQKYGGFEDIVQESPRQAQVRQVPANVKTLLEQKRNTDMNQDQEIALDRNIREALKPLQGENYSSYVAATDAQLGNDGPLLLDKCLSSLPGTFALQLEKTSLSAMKQESPQWVRESIDLENAIHCLPNDRLVLARSRKTNHRIIVTGSPFIPWAENPSWLHRVNGVGNIVAYMELMRKKGYLTEQHFHREKALMQSFLMGLPTEDGDLERFRNSCYMCFPKGCFPTAPPHTLMVSKVLKIGYLEMLYLCHYLGDSLFVTLMKAHGFMHSPNQTLVPFHPNFACPGTPPMGDMPAYPCTQADR